MLQEEGSLPGPKQGLWSNTQKRIDRHAETAKDFIGKGSWDREQQGKETLEDCSAG